MNKKGFFVRIRNGKLYDSKGKNITNDLMGNKIKLEEGKMEKKIHFKIIELKEYQVLVTKDFDPDDNDKPQMIVSFFLDGVKIQLKMGYDTEEKRDRVFDEFGIKNAQGIVDNITKQFA